MPPLVLKGKPELKSANWILIYMLLIQAQTN